MARHRSWTDDDLRHALDGATTIAEVVRRLRLSHGGAAFLTVRTRMEQLGLMLTVEEEQTELPGTNASVGVSRQRRWSDEDLAHAVTKASSLNGVFEALRLAVGGSQWQVVRSRIRELGLDTSHWSRPLHPPRTRTLVGVAELLRMADLDELLDRCTSRAEVLREAGLVPNATSYRALREVLEERGSSGEEAALRRGRSAQPQRPLEEILVAGSSWTNTARLRERLIAAGRKHARCESCGIETWRGQPAPLQLDHIDGDRRNNRLENLRILCANCHAQTPTWCSRNRGNRGDGEGARGVKR